MADELPHVVAVVDEAAPADRRGIYYVLAAALLPEVETMRSLLADVVPSERTRPFHWTVEGPRARARMLDAIVATGVVAHVVVHYPTARRGQEQARRMAMTTLLPLVLADGAEEIIIESRSAHEDQRDRRSVIEALRRADGNIAYRWATKSEPLLWVADAICGAVKEYLLGQHAASFERLETEVVLGGIIYLRPA